MSSQMIDPIRSFRYAPTSLRITGTGPCRKGFASCYNGLVRHAGRLGAHSKYPNWLWLLTTTDPAPPIVNASPPPCPCPLNPSIALRSNFCNTLLSGGVSSTRRAALDQSTGFLGVWASPPSGCTYNTTPTSHCHLFFHQNAPNYASMPNARAGAKMQTFHHFRAALGQNVL